MKNKDSQQGAIGFGWIVAIVLVLGFLGWGMYHDAKVGKLEGELQVTKSELEEVKIAEEETMKLENATAGEVADVIAGIDDPVLRFELFKAYADNIRIDLSAEAQEELDEVVVYVEANMTVLMTAEPQLPEDIAASVEIIKSELADLDAEEVAASSVEGDNVEGLEVGDEVEVTGVLEFAGEDPVTGAGVFIMETDDVTLYFTFSPDNSVNYAANMNGQQVAVTVEITAIDENFATYEVVEGPELVADEVEEETTNIDEDEKGEVEGETDEVEE